MPKPTTKKQRGSAILELLAMAQVKLAQAKGSVRGAYSMGESWTPEQEQELQDAVDTLSATKETVCMALNEAMEDLMNCLLDPPDPPDPPEA